MERQVARAVLLILFIGLGATAAISTPYAWMLGWAFTVLGCSMTFTLYGQIYAGRPRADGSRRGDGMLSFLITVLCLTVGGLVLGLVKGLGWGSLVVAIVTVIGFAVIMVVTLLAELDDLAEDATETQI